MLIIDCDFASLFVARMYTQIILLSVILAIVNCQETAQTPSPSVETSPKSSFVLKPVHDESKVPFEHLLVEHPPEGTNLENYNPERKFVAIPVHSDGGKVNGIVANLVENEGDDNDDLVTAEAIVFRPLFRYRQQQANRRRYYASNNCFNCNRRSGVDRNRNRQRYPDWYQNAEFPVLP